MFRKTIVSDVYFVWKVNNVVLGEERTKEPTDDTSKDVYSLLAQHVSGIIMPIVRRQTE